MVRLHRVRPSSVCGVIGSAIGFQPIGTRSLLVRRSNLRMSNGSQYLVDGKTHYERVGRQHYQDNKDLYKARSVESRKKRREWLDAQKAKPCADCHVSFPPYVMQFDHVRGEKLFNIARSASNYSLDAVLAEIAKCDLVCANCHAVRTHNPTERANPSS